MPARRFRYVETYDKDKDLFRIEYLLVPCAILALVFNYDFDIIEVRIPPAPSLPILTPPLPDLVVILHLHRVGGHHAAAVHAADDRPGTAPYGRWHR